MLRTVDSGSVFVGRRKKGEGNEASQRREREQQERMI